MTHRSFFMTAALPAARLGATFLMLLLAAGCAKHTGGGSVGQAAGFPSPAASPTVTDNLLAQKIRYIFIIYQENQSFDSNFGTFPGVDGIWGRAAADHGFTQTNPITGRSVTPFRITDPDTSDVAHSRRTLIERMNGGRMNNFVAAEVKRNLDEGTSREVAAAMGDLTMNHVDCDTIPYLWYYAKRFALFDRLFQGMTGPSTPGNIELIAAQTGLTQAARHPQQTVDPEGKKIGQPILADPYPQFGPYNTGKLRTRRAFDQTYANVLLELEENQAVRVVNDDADVREDVRAIAARGRKPVPWAWYQEGYANPQDPQRLSYVTHHNAPQYFGYVVENASMRRHLADLTRFYTDVGRGALPDRGVFFVKGGFRNIVGLRPANQNSIVQSHFAGDDDHPGYSDRQISETLVARTVNTIARSKYWNDSVIIIAWDDSEGYWDHVSPPQWERCPDGNPCGDGPRVPAILISPYARRGAIVHDLSDHTSVPKFIQTVFGLPALSSLPDEKPYLPQGPRDWNGQLSNLRGAFDVDRLNGKRKPLPANAAIIPDAVVMRIPSPWKCAAIGARPVPPPPGFSDSPPPEFNPRP